MVFVIRDYNEKLTPLSTEKQFTQDTKKIPNVMILYYRNFRSNDSRRFGTVMERYAQGWLFFRLIKNEKPLHYVL
jgi:hypothetical protein